MNVQIRDQDHGYAQAVRRVNELRSAKPWVKIGVDDRPHSPDGTPTDEIGAAHEFGLGHVPQRSFLRAWADDDTRIASLRSVASRLIEDYIFGHIALHEALAAIGSWSVANVQQRIRLGLQPPLNPKTVERKVREQAALPGYPLLDTLQLEEAVTYEASK